MKSSALRAHQDTKTTKDSTCRIPRITNSVMSRMFTVKFINACLLLLPCHARARKDLNHMRLCQMSASCALLLVPRAPIVQSVVSKIDKHWNALLTAKPIKSTTIRCYTATISLMSISQTITQPTSFPILRIKSPQINCSLMLPFSLP
jgi:hypothetical protein